MNNRNHKGEVLPKDLRLSRGEFSVMYGLLYAKSGGLDVLINTRGVPDEPVRRLARKGLIHVLRLDSVPWGPRVENWKHYERRLWGGRAYFTPKGRDFMEARKAFFVPEESDG